MDTKAKVRMYDALKSNPVYCEYVQSMAVDRIMSTYTLSLTDAKKLKRYATIYAEDHRRNSG